MNKIAKMFSKWYTWVILILVASTVWMIIRRKKDLQLIIDTMAILEADPTIKSEIEAEATQNGIDYLVQLRIAAIEVLKEARSIIFTK